MKHRDSLEVQTELLLTHWEKTKIPVLWKAVQTTKKINKSPTETLKSGHGMDIVRNLGLVETHRINSENSKRIKPQTMLFFPH